MFTKIDATGRYENYSDFGDAFVYKLSTRYKFADDKVTLRGSYSTPSLHQICTQKAQYSFGVGVKPTDNFSFTILKTKEMAGLTIQASLRMQASRF